MFIADIEALALVVMLVGGTVVYLVYKATEPFRRTSAGPYDSISNQIRQVFGRRYSPNRSHSRFMLLPALLPSLFGLVGGVMRQSTAKIQDLEE